MESSLLQCESGPLFSAAQVVQDPADSYKIQLLASIGYHRCDLATVLETAKWQLEDFERAVNSSARMDQSHTREYAISGHKQFIIAIREQINNVEKSLEEMETGNPMKTSKWGNLN